MGNTDNATTEESDAGLSAPDAGGGHADDSREGGSNGGEGGADQNRKDDSASDSGGNTEPSRWQPRMNTEEELRAEDPLLQQFTDQIESCLNYTVTRFIKMMVHICMGVLTVQRI